jgi:hypothetical protein
LAVMPIFSWTLLLICVVAVWAMATRSPEGCG